MEATNTPMKKIKLDESSSQSQDIVQSNKTKTCKHWVKRKKRFCRMIPVKDNDYCGEHQPILIETTIENDCTTKNIRIPCPLDNKHTIYQKNLQKHLTICNARRLEDNQPDYIIKNVNIDKCPDIDSDDLQVLNNIRLNELTDKEFYEIIKKVNDLYEKYVADIVKSTAIDGNNHVTANQSNNYNTYVAAEMKPNEEIGHERLKHLKQVSSLLDILENECLQDKINFIEFGAGKGQLSYYVAKALDNKANSQIVLIDRKSLRHKKDNKIEDRSRIQRIRADIADFNMDKLSIPLQPCVALSKHLCGGATDLTIRCITQCKKYETNFILIALCCHHRCDWRSYVGKDFFKRHQLSHRDFIIITKMVSWAICGTGFSREYRKAIEEDLHYYQPSIKTNEIHLIGEDNSINQNVSINQTCDGKSRLSLAEKEIIGYKCKRLLDYGRLEFLSRYDYEATLKQYVPKSITLENIALVAKRKKNLVH